MVELIIGGAASGKSEYAEKEALRYEKPCYYLATMQSEPEDTEGRSMERIERHRRRRAGLGFETIEKSWDIGQTAGKIRGGCVLLECLTNLVANELFSGSGIRDEDGVFQKLTDDLERVASEAATLIIVSGDVHRDGAVYSKETETYSRLLARINTWCAMHSDRVYEVIYGCPKRIR
jgi:adenosylcobinamide kinase/adenosylcobinamide-phosphate guanylyltransferase